MPVPKFKQVSFVAREYKEHEKTVPVKVYHLNLALIRPEIGLFAALI